MLTRSQKRILKQSQKNRKKRKTDSDSDSDSESSLEDFINNDFSDTDNDSISLGDDDYNPKYKKEK